MTSTTTRRAAIGAIAAAAAIPSTVIAAAAGTAPDPIFAAIDAWREAAEFTERCNEQDEIDRAADAAHELAVAMAETMPTTILGCAALIEAVLKDDFLGDIGWHGAALGAIPKSLRAIVAGRTPS